jgi:hypothetical protein
LLRLGARLRADASSQEEGGGCSGNGGWARLARNLKAEIDEDRIEQYRGTVSLPFEPGDHGRVAVKIVDDRGIESLKVIEVKR